MDDRGVQSLAEAIEYSAGVSAAPYGQDARFEQFMIRGFDENLQGIYRDGMKMPTAGFAGFRQETYGLERVDILRGPTSTLYGLNNPGGLSICVEDARGGRAVRRALGSYGSFDSAQLGFDINGAGIPGTNVTYRLTGLVREGQTQVDYVDDNRVYIAPAVTWTRTRTPPSPSSPTISRIARAIPTSFCRAGHALSQRQWRHPGVPLPRGARRIPL